MTCSSVGEAHRTSITPPMVIPAAMPKVFTVFSRVDDIFRPLTIFYLKNCLCFCLSQLQRCWYWGIVMTLGLVEGWRGRDSSQTKSLISSFKIPATILLGLWNSLPVRWLISDEDGRCMLNSPGLQRKRTIAASTLGLGVKSVFGTIKGMLTL